MYHSVVGKRLVQCVNQRDGTNYTTQTFFDEVYIPLFFGSARLLQNVNNSPFDQAFTKHKKTYTDELRDFCLKQLHTKIQSQDPDASFFLGGPASGSTETTSGQVTSMRIPISEEDVYASWIGAALGLTVQGGMALLIDADDVVLTTYDGWLYYRRFLDQTPSLKPLQVNTWNGQWVASQMASRIREQSFYPATDKDGAALETQKWVHLLFALSYHYRESVTRRFTTYVYSLGKANTTLGFVRLNLPEVRRLVDIYQQLFTVPTGMRPAAFETLYETSESFCSACERTEIGLRALKPKDVFNVEKGVPKPPLITDKEKQIAFDTYQTWIIAMLNNKDLLPRAEELASALNAFRLESTRMKTDSGRMVEGLLSKKNKINFIDELTVLLEKNSAYKEVFDRAVVDLMSLPADNVSLFLTLLRFKYAVAKAKS